MIEWAQGTVDQLVTLARAFTVLVAILSIIMVWYQTKALIPVLTAVLVAGVALWAVSPAGIETLKRWISEDTAGVIVVVELGRGLSEP
jgi:hypothetical protein